MDYRTVLSHNHQEQTTCCTLTQCAYQHRIYGAFVQTSGQMHLTMWRSQPWEERGCIASAGPRNAVSSFWFEVTWFIYRIQIVKPSEMVWTWLSKKVMDIRVQLMRSIYICLRNVDLTRSIWVQHIFIARSRNISRIHVRVQWAGINHVCLYLLIVFFIAFLFSNIYHFRHSHIWGHLFSQRHIILHRMFIQFVIGKHIYIYIKPVRHHRISKHWFIACLRA